MTHTGLAAKQGASDFWLCSAPAAIGQVPMIDVDFPEFGGYLGNIELVYTYVSREQTSLSISTVKTTRPLLLRYR